MLIVIKLIIQSIRVVESQIASRQLPPILVGVVPISTAIRDVKCYFLTSLL